MVVYKTNMQVIECSCPAKQAIFNPVFGFIFIRFQHRQCFLDIFQPPMCIGLFKKAFMVNNMFLRSLIIGVIPVISKPFQSNITVFSQQNIPKSAFDLHALQSLYKVNQRSRIFLHYRACEFVHFLYVRGSSFKQSRRGIIMSISSASHKAQAL